MTNVSNKKVDVNSRSKVTVANSSNKGKRLWHRIRKRLISEVGDLFLLTSSALFFSSGTLLLMCLIFILHESYPTPHYVLIKHYFSRLTSNDVDSMVAMFTLGFILLELGVLGVVKLLARNNPSKRQEPQHTVGDVGKHE